MMVQKMKFANSNRTISVLSQRSQETIRSRPESANNQQLEEVKNDRQVDYAIDNVAETVEQSLEQLEQQLNDARRLTQARREQEAFNFELQDILPVQIQLDQKQQKSAVATDQSTEQQLPLEERLRRFRNNPELYHKAVRDAEEARDSELRRQQQQLQDARIRHKREMHITEPIVLDFVKNNKYRLAHGGMAPDSRALEVQAWAEVEAGRADLAQLRRRQCEEGRAWAERVRQAQQKPPERLLPKTYLDQQRRLGVILHLVARFAVVEKQAKRYELLDGRNVRLYRSATEITKFARMHQQRTFYLSVTGAAARLQKYVKFYLNLRNARSRRRILLRAREFLDAEYAEYTLLGAVSRFYECYAYLRAECEQYRQQMDARVGIIALQLQYMDELALEKWRGMREAQLANQRARLRANPKRHKEYKAFVTEHPEGEEIAPESEEDMQQLATLVPSQKEIRCIALCTVQEIQRRHAEDLEYCFRQNSSPAQTNIMAFSFLVSKHYIEHVYAALCGDVDIQLVVASAKDILLVPERKFAE